MPLNGGRHGNNFAEGQRLLFFCHQGYDLIGVDEPLCIAGQWSSDPPVCKPKGIRQKDRQTVGRPDGRTDRQTVGRTDGQIDWQSTGQTALLNRPHPMRQTIRWLKGFVLFLTGDTCTRPNSLPNVRVYGPNKQFYKKGELLFHMCAPGYVLLGTGVWTCQGNTWSNNLFKCSRKFHKIFVDSEYQTATNLRQLARH